MMQSRMNPKGGSESRKKIMTLRTILSRPIQNKLRPLNTEPIGRLEEKLHGK